MAYPSRPIILAVLLLNTTLFPKSASSEAENFGKKKEYPKVKIEKVLQADTLVLEGGEKIRLIGVSAAEIPRRRREPEQVDPYGFPTKREVDPEVPVPEQAFHFSKDLLEGQYVKIEFDEELKNDDFQTLGYVFLKDGTFVNAELLRQGFVNLKLSPPNMKYAEQLRSAYQEARREKRGLQGE